MKIHRPDVSNERSLSPEAYVYELETYGIIPIEKRPIVIICPGGGYDHTSDREGEIVAMQFLAKGFHAALLRYSCAPARYPTALLELARLMLTIRENVDVWHIDPDRVVLMGFSAGGHLVGSYCATWQEGFFEKELEAGQEMFRPNAQVLCYPVITGGEYAHEGSFNMLFGEDVQTQREAFSLEKRIGSSIPRTFVWNTYEDGSVPVQNSLLYVNALVEHKIPVEYHLFEKGGHGVSLGNHLSSRAGDKDVVEGVQCWVEMAHRWIGSYF